MEARFAHDFSRVRVHAGPAAADTAAALHARAFTFGSDIVFGANQYSPDTYAGRRLIAHELAHVVQQASHPPVPQARLDVSTPGDVGEREAEAAADLVMSGYAAPPLGAARSVLARTVQGDVRQQSITARWARDLTDAELDEQIAIVQRATQDSDELVRRTAAENARVLADERSRRGHPAQPDSARAGTTDSNPQPSAPPSSTPAVGPPLSTALGAAMPAVPLATPNAPPTRVPLRLVPSPPPASPPTAPPVFTGPRPLPWYAGGALGAAIIAGLVVFLIPNSTAQPWQDTINPFTGRVWRDRAEWEQVGRMSPQEFEQELARRRGSRGETGSGRPVTPPVAGPSTVTPTAGPRRLPWPAPPPSTSLPTPRRHPTQTCENPELDAAQKWMHAICDRIPGQSCSPSKVSPGRLERQPCSAIRLRIEALRECIRRRNEVQAGCFGGMPDPRHVEAIRQVNEGLAHCVAREAINCAPGHPKSGL